MSTNNESKINRLLQSFPEGTVMLSSWLVSQGYSLDLQKRYRRSNWLESIGIGAMIRKGDKVNYEGAIFALQNQAHMTIHPGGKTALGLLGKAHYLELSTKSITLFSAQDEKLTRELQPLESNLGKRLVKSSKLYIRDSGILHSLLNISDFEELVSHPVFGFSWEGFVIDNICTYLNEFETFFYKTSQGAELDLVLVKGNKKIAFEFKVGDAPKPTRGFWNAVEDIKPEITFIVSPLADEYPISENVWGIGINELFDKLDSYRN